MCIYLASYDGNLRNIFFFSSKFVIEFDSLIKFHCKTHISVKSHSQRIFTANPYLLKYGTKGPNRMLEQKINPTD